MENCLIKDSVKEIMKCVFLYLMSSIMFIFIFALILMNTNINEDIIYWVLEFIKIISLFIAVFLSIKNGKGLFKGSIAGFFSGLLLYLIFLIFRLNTFSIKVLFIELLFSIILGGVFGILCVNIKRR